MTTDERPDAWQPTPGLRWLERQWAEETEWSDEVWTSHTLQQQWHIPNSEQYDWRDMPTVREEGDE